MIDKVMWVGAGQAGCKIADVAKKLKYPVAYINLSSNDLRALEHAEPHEQLLIRGNGAGKDREYAKKMLDINVVVNFFHEQLRNRDIRIILFSFSTGGGSGSGISPILIEALQYEFPNILFIALPILPDLNESYIAQMNTIQAIHELSSLNLAVFPIDNQQNSTISRIKSFDCINNRAVNAFHHLFSYTQIDSNNQFDETDLIKLLSETGNGTITEIDFASLDKPVNLITEEVAKSVQYSWVKSIFSPIELDYVTSAAVIYDCQESLLDISTESLFSNFATPPLYIFNGIYHGQKGNVITVLTGLPWCKSRLIKIEELISIYKVKYESVLTNSKKYEVGSGVKAMRNTSQETKQVKKPDWRELVNKYKN